MRERRPVSSTTPGGEQPPSDVSAPPGDQPTAAGEQPAAPPVVHSEQPAAMSTPGPLPTAPQVTPVGPPAPGPAPAVVGEPQLAYAQPFAPAPPPTHAPQPYGGNAASGMPLPFGPGGTIPQPPARRPRVAVIVLSVVLGLIVIAGAATAVWLVLQLGDARTQIDEQQQEIDDQRRELDEQRELIEQKETFGAAMNRLLDGVEPLIGLPFATLVPWTEYDVLASRAWANRWDADALAADIARADELAAELEAKKAAALAQVSSNASGTTWETALDQLGSGWVTASFEGAAAVCGDALACVLGADPYTVHIAHSDPTDDSMTDWIRTGVAYHEFAHVLQGANPDRTATAVVAFDGDHETMADCYALTFLDGWTLDHEVWIDSSSYWKVNVGYGYTCNDSQRQVIRDWVGGLGIVKQTVGG